MTTLFLVLAVALATAVVFGKPGAWKKVVGAAYVVYPAILIANAWTLWWTYGRVEAALRTAGWVVDQYLLTAATMALALLLYTITPIVIGAFVKRQKWQFVALFALVFCGSNILLYLVSRPAPEQISNPKTGVSLYNFYRDTQRNCVERIPRGNEFHPNHIGVKLLPPDDAIAQEWIKHPCDPDPISQDLAKAKNQLATAQMFNQEEAKRQEAEAKRKDEEVQSRNDELKKAREELVRTQELLRTEQAKSAAEEEKSQNLKLDRVVAEHRAKAQAIVAGLDRFVAGISDPQTDADKLAEQTAVRPTKILIDKKVAIYFELRGCLKNSDRRDRIVCFLKITNNSNTEHDFVLQNDADQWTREPHSFLVDEFSKRCSAVSSSLGSFIGTYLRPIPVNNESRAKLVPGIPLAATLVFIGCDERTQKLLDLRVGYHAYTISESGASVGPNVDFKNVPVAIETAEAITELTGTPGAVSWPKPFVKQP